MRYNTYINNAKCLEWDLSLNQGALFDLLNQLSSWADSAFVNGKTYYFVSREKIIEELPLAFQKPDTVYRAVKTLMEKNLINWIKVGSKDMVCITSKGSEWNLLTNSEINPSVGNKSECRIQIRADSEINPSAYIDDNNTRDNIPPYNPPKGEVSRVEKPKTSKVNFSFEAMKGFEPFWAAYPKQRAGNKQKAFAAYVRVLREKRADMERLQRAVEAYTASDEVAKGFAKGCAAWLNNDRFNDQYQSDGMTVEEQERYEKLKAAEQAREEEQARKRQAEEVQEKIMREKNIMMSRFFENKGYSRASLAVNNPRLYRELKSEFEILYAGG